MQRIVYAARLKLDKIDSYKRAHKQVPSELIQEATECGIKNHSCFLRGRDLIIYLETESYVRTLQALASKIATQKWERRMAEFFDPTFVAQDEAPWEEVFHME